MLFFKIYVLKWQQRKTHPQQSHPAVGCGRRDASEECRLLGHEVQLLLCCMGSTDAPRRMGLFVPPPLGCLCPHWRACQALDYCSSPGGSGDGTNAWTSATRGKPGLGLAPGWPGPSLAVASIWG